MNSVSTKRAIVVCSHAVQSFIIGNADIHKHLKGWYTPKKKENSVIFSVNNDLNCGSFLLESNHIGCMGHLMILLGGFCIIL